MVPVSEVDRLAGRPPKVPTGTNLSARNRLDGVVRSVEADRVMALVEIEAGPYLLAAAITRDAVEELGLRPGVRVVATIKATSVMVGREGGPAR
jgi:molybdopterin-binding protein